MNREFEVSLTRAKCYRAVRQGTYDDIVERTIGE